MSSGPLWLVLLFYHSTELSSSCQTGMAFLSTPCTQVTSSHHWNVSGRYVWGYSRPVGLRSQCISSTISFTFFLDIEDSRVLILDP